MNLTIREVLSQIKVPNKFVNADSKITNKYIYSLLKKHRDTLVKQLDGKYELMRLRYLFQTLDCVDLIPSPTISECCGVRTPHVIYRTREKLPSLVNSNMGPVFGRITSIDGSNVILGISPQEWNRKMENTNMKYMKDLYYYFYSDGYLYFPNLEWNKIKIEGYFDEEVDHAPCLCGEREDDCRSFLDNKFRIPRHILTYVIDSVNKEIAGLYDNVQEDEDINKNTNRKN